MEDRQTPPAGKFVIPMAKVNILAIIAVAVIAVFAL